MRIRIYFSLLFVFLSYFPVLAQVDTAWVRKYNGPGNGYDAATALAVDDSGNVYVTGESYGSNYSDYATIKYTPSGETLWMRRYDGGNTPDRAFALAVDKSGNVYTTGCSGCGFQGSRYTTIKYAPNGDVLWVESYGSQVAGGSVANSDAIAVDDLGNVYVAGGIHGYDSTWFDYFTIKYDPNGDTLWVRRYNSGGKSYDEATAVAVDNTGNVYVTGESNGAYASIKYAPNGDLLWVRHYAFNRSELDKANDLAVDNNGNVYVTGASADGNRVYDYATIKYAPNGDTLWARRYVGPANGGDVANALTVDRSGNLYVTGYNNGSGATILEVVQIMLPSSMDLPVTHCGLNFIMDREITQM